MNGNSGALPLISNSGTKLAYPQNCSRNLLVRELGSKLFSPGCMQMASWHWYLVWSIQWVVDCSVGAGHLFANSFAHRSDECSF